MRMNKKWIRPSEQHEVKESTKRKSKEVFGQCAHSPASTIPKGDEAYEDTEKHMLYGYLGVVGWGWRQRKTT